MKTESQNLLKRVKKMLLLFFFFNPDGVISMVNPHGKLYSCFIASNEIRSAMKGQVNAKLRVTLLLTASADAEN